MDSEGAFSRAIGLERGGHSRTARVSKTGIGTCPQAPKGGIHPHLTPTKRHWLELGTHLLPFLCLRRIYALLVLVVLLSPELGYAAASPGGNRGILLGLATNCPAFTELVMGYRTSISKELCFFRFQTNAFSARITERDSFAEAFDPHDTVCGYWDQEYWYYSFSASPAPGAAPVPLTLYHYHYSTDDTNSIAYQVHAALVAAAPNVYHLGNRIRQPAFRSCGKQWRRTTPQRPGSLHCECTF